MSLSGPTTKRGAETAEYHRAYYEARKDETRRRARERYAANRRAVAERSRARRASMSADARVRRYAKAQDARRLREFGLPKGQYSAMLKAQGGVCALCGEAESGRTRLGTPIALHVDHDHTTGQIRALLCGNCNRAIGHLKDDPALIRKAALYVEAYRVQSRSA